MDDRIVTALMLYFIILRKTSSESKIIQDAEKSLARPGRIQANVSVRMA